MAKAKQAKDKPSKDTKKKQVKHAEVTAEAVPVGASPEADIQVEDEPKVTAKAGKHSAKAQKETEAKQAKALRKASVSSEAAKKPAAKSATRTKADRAGKKYRQALEQIDKTRVYLLSEAIEMAIRTSPVKFDASVEMHINLGVDPKQADQNIRDTIVLPAGTGKNIKIAVFAESDDAAAAKKAGADYAGSDEIIAKLDKEEIDFDVLIATPAMMPRLGRYARMLGPRGLMPNPKSGTVSQNPISAVNDAKAGRVEYRVDQSGIVHLAIGKVSFGPEKLAQNAEAVLNSVKAARPASLKGIYIKSLYLTSSMGPSVKAEVQ
jgi:large subunit ribosomal protein L1